MIDVVIPLGTGSDYPNHEELRYCLRSLEQNLNGLRDIYVVGDKPKWSQNIIHISAEDTLKRNKDGNLINKVLLTCNKKELSNPFVRISDDQLLLQTCTIEDLQPGHAGDLGKLKTFGKAKWRRRLERTYHYLIKNGYTAYNFDTHIPFVVDKQRFIDIFSNIDYESDIGYCINTLFFNICLLNPEKSNYIYDEKCSVERQMTQQEIENKLKGKKFLGFNPYGANDALITVLRKLFPMQSKYESYPISANGS